MKNLLFFALFSFTFSSTFSQESINLLDSPFMYSTGSRIEINSKGDTILVSEQVTSIANGQNRQLATTPNRFVARGGDIVLEFKGTPYFINQWHEGEITLEDNEILKGFIAYDVVYNSVYFTENTDVLASLVQPKSFTINANTFFLLDEMEDRELNPFYYTSIVEGTHQLLRRENGKFIKKDFFSYNNTQNEFSGEYVKESLHYLYSEGELVKISPKASFFAKLGTKSIQAKKIVQDENLDLNKIEDIIKFTRIMNMIFTS
jgi:hypothetical protein